MAEPWSEEEALEAYRDFWLEELARIRRERGVVAGLVSTLNDVRGDLFDRITFASKVWDYRTAQLILTEVERSLGFWSNVTSERLMREMELAWDSGAAQTTSVVKAAGLQVSVAPFISRRMLELSTQTVPVAISGISRDLQTKIGRELRRSVLAEESPLQFLQRIGSPVPTVKAPPGFPAINSGAFEGMLAARGALSRGPLISLPAVGHFPTAFHRAEAIYRTEIGRLASMSNQATLGEVARIAPNMKKRWSSIFDVRTRPAHRGAHGQVRDWDDTFSVGYEGLMYPRDGRASPSNTINCRCVSLPWNDDWASAGADAVLAPKMVREWVDL